MRLKSLPRKVIRNGRKSCIVENGEKCLEILNKRNECFLNLENPIGLDLSTKKKVLFLRPSCTLQLGKVKRKISHDVSPPKQLNLNNTIIYKDPQIEMNEIATSFKSPQEDKFKDTFLYQMMTDPKFFENMQKSKRRTKLFCQFCKNQFETETELNDHLKVRLDESKRVICCACEKTFTQKRYLRYHQRCHSERSKFVCDICLRRYSRLDNLTRHNVFHTNPNKFPCTMCDRAFARKDLLNKHQKSHENKYKWYCNTCRKYFKGPVALENHMKVFHKSGTNCNTLEYNVQMLARCPFRHS